MLCCHTFKSKILNVHCKSMFLIKGVAFCMILVNFLTSRPLKSSPLILHHPYQILSHPTIISLFHYFIIS